MNSYPAYRDSGTLWPGQIPASWGISPLKYLCHLINGAAFKPGEWQQTGIPIIRIENLNGLDEFNYYPSGVDAKYIVREGDLLFAWSGNRGTSFGPYLWKHPGEYYLNQHIFRVTGYTCSKLWLYWALMGATRYIEEQAHGIIGLVHITKEELGKIQIPLPPRGEQDAIVAHLERKLTEIDRFIANKERLIALLKDQKIAIINRAATHGLNPNAPMKSSGIEWLREIPAHWVTAHCKNLFHEIDSRSVAGEEPLLSLRMNEGLVLHNEVSERPVTSDQLIGYKCIHPGQLVMNRMRAASGLFAVAQTSGLVSPDYAVFQLKVSANIYYYAYLFKTPMMQDVFRINSKGLGTGSSGFLRLYTDRFGVIPIPRPPLQEQADIVRFIGEESQRIEEAVSRAEREIELIKEYRTTLISDAVTGKIDVRAAVAEEVRA